MMGDMTREPSMEEILSSIRRVIARDEGRRDAFAAALDPEDVLDLTEANAERLHDSAEEGAVMPGSPPSTPMANDSEDALVSRISASASRQSLDALAAALAEQQHSHTAPAAPASGGDVTLNVLVEAMLRPMLRDWLDTNLPAIVEKMVAREIARITNNS